MSSFLLLVFLITTAIAELPSNTVRVCTSHEMKNAVADACNFYKRSIRFPEPSPFEGYRYEMTRKGYVEPARYAPGQPQYQHNRNVEYADGYRGQPEYQPEYQPNRGQPEYQPNYEEQPPYQGPPVYSPGRRRGANYQPEGARGAYEVRRTSYGDAYSRNSYNAKLFRPRYYASPIAGYMHYPMLFRSKRSATDNSDMDKIMRKCCYEGCPLNWFAALCY